MNQRFFVAVVLCLTVIAAHADAANTAAPAAAKEHLANFPAYQCELVAGQYDTMARVLSLTDDQKTHLRTICAEMDGKLEEWENDAMEKAKAHDEAYRLRVAQADHDTMVPATPEEVAAELAIANARQSIVDIAQDKIREFLTADQRAAWESFNIQMVVGIRFPPRALKLTAAQSELIAKISQDAGKEMAQIENPHDPATISHVYGKIYKRIFAEVLTDEQAAGSLGTTNFANILMLRAAARQEAARAGLGSGQ